MTIERTFSRERRKILAITREPTASEEQEARSEVNEWAQGLTASEKHSSVPDTANNVKEEKQKETTRATGGIFDDAEEVRRPARLALPKRALPPVRGKGNVVGEGKMDGDDDVDDDDDDDEEEDRVLRHREGVGASEEKGDRPTFEASTTFAGARPGYLFKNGPKGLGYYADVATDLDMAERVVNEQLEAARKRKAKIGG